MSRFFYAFSFSLIILLSACKKTTPERTGFLMNTVCTINLFEDGTDELYDEIFFRLKEIENEFSVTIQDSEISKINQNAGIKPIEVSLDVLNVTKTALEICKISDGIFNIALNPIIKLWGINTKNARIPTEQEIQEALKKCDYNKIKIKEKLVEEKPAIYIEENGMSLNLSAIVKGFATDQAVMILKNHNVKRAIIDLGGNLYLYGKKRNGEKWNVGIKNPKDPAGIPLLTLQIDENSVVTSGTYERYFKDGEKKYHHIFDSKTGRPTQNDIASVTVISSSSTICDALSTTFLAAGKERAQKILADLKQQHDIQVEAIFVYEDGSTEKISSQ